MVSNLYLSAAMLERLRNYAAAAAPDECVGLLLGHGERVTRLVPLTNASKDPRTRFFAPPQELLAALNEADDRGEAVLGSYHSHPRTPAWPSEADLEAPGGTVMLIVGEDAVRAFRIEGGEAVELELRVV